MEEVEAGENTVNQTSGNSNCRGRDTRLERQLQAVQPGTVDETKLTRVKMSQPLNVWAADKAVHHSSSCFIQLNRLRGL